MSGGMRETYMPRGEGCQMLNLYSSFRVSLPHASLGINASKSAQSNYIPCHQKTLKRTSEEQVQEMSTDTEIMKQVLQRK